jgi:Domain of unknown function (DUF5667)
MMSMAGARRQAEDFAAAADGHAPTSLDAETQAFLSIVGQLRELDPPTPHPAFAASLRAQLIAAAATALTPTRVKRSPATRPQPQQKGQGQGRRRVLAAAAVTCVVASSGMGVAAASQSSLPGDTLYPVKRGIENIGVSIASGHVDRGEEYVKSADARLSEAQDLATERAGDPSTAPLIAATLNDFNGAAGNGAIELIDAFQQESSEGSIVELRAFASASAQQLNVLRATVPSNVRGYVLLAARTVVGIDDQARTACAWCSSLPPITLAGTFGKLQKNVSDSVVPLPPLQTGQPGRRFPGVTSPDQVIPQPGDSSVITLPPETLPTVPAAPGALPSPHHGRLSQSVSPHVLPPTATTPTLTVTDTGPGPTVTLTEPPTVTSPPPPTVTSPPPPPVTSPPPPSVTSPPPPTPTPTSTPPVTTSPPPVTTTSPPPATTSLPPSTTAPPSTSAPPPSTTAPATSVSTSISVSLPTGSVSTSP